MRKSLWIIALLFAAFVAPKSQADTVYTYTGNPLQCTYSCNFTPALSISFSTTLTGSQLDNLNFANISADITSFSFTILGINTSATQATPYIEYNFEISTDSNGDITSWYAEEDNAGNPDADVHSIIISCNYASYPCASPNQTLGFSGIFDAASFMAADVGSNIDDPGTWTVTSTPESGTVVFLLLGIVSVLLMRKRIATGPPPAS